MQSYISFQGEGAQFKVEHISCNLLHHLKAVETFKVAKKLLLKLGIIYKRKNHQISQNLSTYTSIPYVTKEGKWVKKKGW